MSQTAKHPRPPELVDASLDDIMDKFVARFSDRKADWNAFADASIEGYRRAQHRFIGAGGSGKHDAGGSIPPYGFTLSVMYLPVGQGNPAHTHEIEEVFFVLKGYLDVFVEDEEGNRKETRLGPWECISCPPGVIHGFQNNSLEPVYFQVMIGRGRPDAMGYKDPELYAKRESHLKSGE